MKLFKAIILFSLMVINVTPLLNPNHKEFFKSTAEELICYGGANAGKSYSASDKITLYPTFDKNYRESYRKKHNIKLDPKKEKDHKLKALVIRKTLPSLKATCMEMVQNSANKFDENYKLHQQDSNGQLANMKILYRSLNSKEEIEKVMSITDVDLIWIEEANQITEADYEKLVSRLRGGKGYYSQIILTFNPIGKNSWIYKRFFEKNIGDVHKIKYTIADNPWATEKEKKRLKRTKSYNKNFYNIYYLGDWGELEGVIYNWDIVPLPTDLVFDEIFYGSDFGFSIDPAVLVRIYRKSNHFWVEEMLYETGLTNPKMGRRMLQEGYEYPDPDYCDCAEPKSIQELIDVGINAIPCLKGADSRRAGIDFCIEQNIHIVEGSENISKEQKSYCWKIDRDGNKTGKPIEYNDHAMSAIRYGINTHCKNINEFFIGQSKKPVYGD